MRSRHFVTRSPKANTTPTFMFPIIFGIGEQIRTTGSGSFHCPNCGPDRDYRRERRAQCFYVFFVPVFPLNEWPELVVCNNCCSQFTTSVLFYNPELDRQDRDERPDRIKLVMILTLIRAELIPEASLQRIEDVVRAEVGEDILREHLDREIAEARALEIDPLVELIRIAQKFKSKGASTVLRYAFLAASATGTLSEEDEIFLDRLREALGISQFAFRRIIVTAAQDFTGQRSHP